MSTVKIHGRDYETVDSRVMRFREDTNHSNDKLPIWTIATEIVSAEGDLVVMKASILDDAGRVIATGHAEENRKASQINKTSALENCETSAVGRALAFLGYSGNGIASADEVSGAIFTQHVQAISEAKTPDALKAVFGKAWKSFEGHDEQQAILKDHYDSRKEELET